jgi:endonuclease YncB( thermonuclease family)
MTLTLVRLALTAIALSGTCSPLAAEGLHAGPVPARVGKVVDGDSFNAEAMVWPGTTIAVAIRIRGIDAPELRARCASERRLARRARDRLAAMAAGQVLDLSNVGGDKYYGRVLADVRLQDGRDLAAVMLESAPVRQYGGRRRQGWCPVNRGR